MGIRHLVSVPSSLPVSVNDLHPARFLVARENANGERKTSNFLKFSGALILKA
jgi:hypothetical protein